MARLHLLPALLLVLFAGLLGPAPEADAAPRRGAIRGRLSSAGLQPASRVQFLVDGAARRARVRRGHFLIRGVRAGEHVLSVIDAAGNLGAHRRVRVRGGGTAQVGTLSLAPGGQIAGIVSRVVDGALQPVEGVEVVAEREAEEPPNKERPSGRGKEKDAPRLVAVTEADGAYRFRGVPPGPYRVSVVVPGLEAGVEFVYVEVGRTSVADFPLREVIEKGVGTVTGTVTNPAGEPVVGALVTILPGDIYYPAAVSASSRERAARRGRPAGVEPRTLPRVEFNTLTDRRGEYRLNVPSGYLSLWAQAEGYLPEWRELTLRAEEVLTVDLTLPALPEPEFGEVEGRVTDARTGLPLAGARVSLLIFVIQERGPQPRIFPLPFPEFTTYTDAEGRYRLEGVPAGWWDLQAEREGYESQIRNVRVEGGKGVEAHFELVSGKTDRRRR